MVPSPAADQPTTDPLADDLLDGLNPRQLEAVTSQNPLLCILAGAGSGKTRVLTRRIAWRSATGGLDPRRVLALTFTRKAAGELTSRLRQLGLRDSVAAGTFHAVAYAQLRTRWNDRGIEAPQLLERKVGFVARLMPRNLTSGKGRRGAAAEATLPLDVVSEIEWAKARMITPSRYAAAADEAGREPPVPFAAVADVYERYEIEKKTRRLVDFDDMLRLHARDMKVDDAYAEAVRWRFQHVFVDEFQDVNPQQFDLLKMWLGDNRDLCVVGDPNQAIYAWNGADAQYINHFGRFFPGCEIVQLTDNYRSSPQILGVANIVLARPGTGRRTGEVPELRANRPDGPVPTITEYPDDSTEAAAVARAVRDARAPGTPWSAQAVLVRTNAQTALIEQALRAAQVPSRVRGGAGLLDQPEVKAALKRLQSATVPLAVALADLEAELAEGDETAAGNARAGVDADNREANVEALVRMGRDYLVLDPSPTVAGFVAWATDTARSDQPDGRGDAVDVVTFHAAKGLEWPVVHLAGLEQGLVPIGHAQTPAELAEERRLFYVALTRAERELHLSWAAERVFGSRTSKRTRSIYLDDVEAACDALREGRDPLDWARRLAEQRAALRAATPKPTTRTARARRPAADAVAELSDDDRAVFDALKAWRTETAKAGAVPAYVVFPDATLVAIAQARPTSPAELLDLPGVGPVKVNRYGDGVLGVVRAADG